MISQLSRDKVIGKMFGPFFPPFNCAPKFLPPPEFELPWLDRGQGRGGDEGLHGMRIGAWWFFFLQESHQELQLPPTEAER